MIRPFARAIAADSFTTGYDATTRTFSLSYPPAASGVTEVSLPARVYADGFDVQVTGACVDSSHAGELLLRADAGATEVALKVTPK